MTEALTPALALDYLRALSADVRAGVVVGGAGETLAGPEPVADAARALLAAAPNAEEVQVALPEGTVFAVRDDRHAIAVACGRHALPALARYDLRVVLGELAGNRRAAA